MPTPTLGAFFRATRMTRKPKLSQAKLARLAGVSRRQLAALENGANVSYKFIDKVAGVLEIDAVPLSSKLQLVAPPPNVDIAELLSLADILDSVAEQLRHVVLAAVVPSDPTANADVSAIREFVARNTPAAVADPARLDRALRRLSSDGVAQTPEPLTRVPSRKRARRLPAKR